MRTTFTIKTAAFMALALVASCGDTPVEQALMGGGAGAAGAAVLNGNVLAGAAVGAAGNVLYCQKYPTRC
ncbi:hypothetical protein U5922_005210 [Aquicoccus sp. G2-2]|uniref:hypothetical protein n=1 Tax=Aquicoccus sp. G2-2 TaxID=3092120 RepID=UPI00366F8742